MPVATEPRPATLPLPGGLDGARVRVHPIITGEMHAPPAYTDRPAGRLAKARIARQLLGPRDRWNWLPVPAFLIEHPGAGPLLIDTGLHPSCAGGARANMGVIGGLIYEIRMEHDQALRFQLPARGIQSSEVRLVIMTHLHIDHASAVSEFPQATFVIDRREWDAAAHGGFRRGYHTRQFDHAFDWRTIDFEADAVDSFSAFARSVDLLGDGSIRLVSTPGHTAGHVSVVVRTAQRELLIVADAAYTERELRGQAASLVCHDRHLHQRSLKEIGRYLEETPDAIAIPAHDWELWRRLDPVYP